jgi:hypothetical protein
MVEVKGNNRNTILQELESIRHLLDEDAVDATPTQGAQVNSPSSQTSLFAEPESTSSAPATTTSQPPIAPRASQSAISENNPFLPPHIRERLILNQLNTAANLAPADKATSSSQNLHYRLVGKVLDRLQTRIEIIIREELASLSADDKQQLQQETLRSPE